jgi:hypothetical protein
MISVVLCCTVSSLLTVHQERVSINSKEIMANSLMIGLMKVTENVSSYCFSCQYMGYC